MPLQQTAEVHRMPLEDALPSSAGAAVAATPPKVVLDTNVVMDWLVFCNAGVQPLVRAIEQGDVCWLASQDMQDELMHVLSRGSLEAWQPDVARLWRAWSDWATLVPAVVLQPLHAGLRCRDADDQKFVDLAVANQARWLVSRDRAVLALSRRARALGVTICTPERWPGAVLTP